MATSLNDAKARVAAEKAKLTTAIKAVAGSRVLIGVFGALLLAFAAHAFYFPERLPSLAHGLSIASIGLPADLDFGAVGEGAKQARDAAIRQGGVEKAQSFLAAYPILTPIINWAGAVAALALLLWALAIQSDIRRRKTLAARTAAA